MEIVICEVESFEHFVGVATQRQQQRELSEFELALVGGGVGDVSLG